MIIQPVAFIETGFRNKFGLPRQSGRVRSLVGRITFAPEFRHPEALRGIEQFSHLWLIFDFSESHRDGWSPTVRPPRLGGNTRVGVFASRSPFRPNSLGLSSVRLERVEWEGADGPALIVSGVDLLSGTPIYDIKPYLPYTDSHPHAAASYADMHRNDRIDVVIPDALSEKIPVSIRQVIIDCIAEDPRPSYQDDPERVYGMTFGGVDVRFVVRSGTATVVAVESANEEEG